MFGLNLVRLKPNSNLALRLIGVAALVVSAVGLAVLPVAAEEPAPAPAVAEFEADFMRSMIDHHAMAVEMAQVCVERAAHEELRALCRQVINAQSQEIQTLQRWLGNWYDTANEPQISPEDRQMIEALTVLSGAEFEMAFMQEIIGHHSQATRMALGCLARADHGRLLDLCESILVSQSGEIGQLQAWLCRWDDVCETAG